METEDRQQSDLIKETACSRSVEFDFYRLLSLLEAREGRPLGTSGSPKRERFRLAQEISLNFPPSAVASANYSPEQDRIAVILRCIGIMGAQGVLPSILSEHIERRVRSKRDKTLYSFINLFQHRLFSLFYRAWALNQRSIDHTWGEEQRQRDYHAALVGIMGRYEEEEARIEPRALMYHSGTFSGFTANRDALVAFLRDYFEVSVELSEFVGNWLEIPREERACLGRVRETTTLGLNAVVGERIWSAHLRYRLKIGPVDHEDFLRFLPNHKSFYKLKDALRRYVGDHYDCVLTMTLKAESVPALALGKTSYLGWNTWLGRRQTSEDAREYSVNLNRYKPAHYGFN
jgi:type VI secretion system protein ImpH